MKVPLILFTTCLSCPTQLCPLPSPPKLTRAPTQDPSIVATTTESLAVILHIFCPLHCPGEAGQMTGSGDNADIPSFMR
ncbi:unnamed protein product [Protopolystoma xenopodis]|uniref:Uncharacterized protein n=1 Tax=Protopolystoma xenopodis TaxID=117903 RepID=A0A3S5B0U4_9PLAT|nr:unnamed protein product [Protopolystoma xenopodis]